MKYCDYFDICDTEKKQDYNNIFLNIPKSFQGYNYWILKPNDLCQGQGIKISNNNEYLYNISKKYFSGAEKNIKNNESVKNDKIKRKKRKPYLISSLILQKYLEHPLLYNNRKFDIRVWVLIDHLANAYIFKEGHLKASSESYTLDNISTFGHLTNYSVQKYSPDFNKFEYGNEIAFSKFEVIELKLLNNIFIFQ